MNSNFKTITMKSIQPLTILVLIVGILIGCQSAYEEVIAKDDNGNVTSTYMTRKEDGVKHGKYQIFIETVLAEEGNYKEGKQDGLRTLFFVSGKTQIKEQYTDGNITSKETFFENGNLESEGQYDAAVMMSGEWKYYYQNGKVREIVNFKNNVEDGVFKEFYDNGNIKAEGTYIPVSFGEDMEGVEQGELKEYNKEGELVTKKNCESGKCTTIWEAEKK